jgi:hypothetical protein
MRSKNIKPDESAHMAEVKLLPCAVCGDPGPSDAHHIEQGLHFLTIPLCRGCHQDPRLGIHGAKVMWRIHKKTELSCLNETIRNLRP